MESLRKCSRRTCVGGIFPSPSGISYPLPSLACVSTTPTLHVKNHETRAEEEYSQWREHIQKAREEANPVFTPRGNSLELELGGVTERAGIMQTPRVRAKRYGTSYLFRAVRKLSSYFAGIPARILAAATYTRVKKLSATNNFRTGSNTKAHQARQCSKMHQRICTRLIEEATLALTIYIGKRCSRRGIGWS